MTPLRDLVETSRIVAEKPGRNAKIAALAAFFRRLAPAEIAIGVSYLSGETRPGRTGIGYALFQEASAGIAAETAPLVLEEVDAAFARIVATSGAGSKAARARILAALLSPATPPHSRVLFL